MSKGPPPNVLKDVKIVGFKTGIVGASPTNLVMDNVSFVNVERPIDLAPGSTLKARGTRISNDPKISVGKQATENKTGGNQSGWRKLSGPPLPSFCPRCKTIFPSKNYNFSGTYFNSWDNEDVCPACGFEHAKLSEGIFNIVSDAIQVIRAPDLTHAMLRAIKDIADGVLANKINPDEAVKKFANVSPKVGKIARRALRFGASGVMLISAVAAAYLAYVQVGLQTEANRSSDVALERTLEALSALQIRLGGVCQTPNQEGTEPPSNNPAAGKAISKPGAAKLKSKRKLKKSKPRAR